MKKTERPMHIGIALNATADEFKGVTGKKSYDEIAKRVAKTKGYVITAEYMDGYIVLGEYRTRTAARAALPKVRRIHLADLGVSAGEANRLIAKYENYGKAD